jgi:hypothetical protein
VSHLIWYYTNISNEIIANIIDESCVPYLQVICNKLGLDDFDFINQTDINQYLQEHHQILPNVMLRNISGSNILYPAHNSQFLNLLTKELSPSKDWIESLPSPSGYGMATHTICADTTTLTFQFIHYVSGKLPDSSATMNPWDDNNYHSNPRVFQGWVWGYIQVSMV